MKFVILAAMFFCHIFDDFYLQGILANMKQINWWQENAPQAMYDNDYLVALIEHAFSWSFSISIPLLVAAFVLGSNDSEFLDIFGLYFFNTAIHGIVDHLKANDKIINLIADQTIHGMQILITWLTIIDRL